MNSSAASLGLASCHTCSLVSRVASDDALCPRCGSRVHLRKPGSIGHCWAFLIAAMILYIPANTLPMMLTSSLFGSSDDTIISGVLFLWEDGSWYLALIVFFASILVPIGKMLALLVLLLSVQLPGVPVDELDGVGRDLRFHASPPLHVQIRDPLRPSALAGLVDRFRLGDLRIPALGRPDRRPQATRLVRGRPHGFGVAARNAEVQQAQALAARFEVKETFAIGPTVLNDRIDYITREATRSPIRVVGFFLVKDGKIAEWTDYVVRT